MLPYNPIPFIWNKFFMLPLIFGVKSTNLMLLCSRTKRQLFGKGPRFDKGPMFSKVWQGVKGSRFSNGPSLYSVKKNPNLITEM